MYNTFFTANMTVYIYLLVGFLIRISDGSEHEEKLLKDLLFKDHRINMRPVLHDNDTITVTIGLSLSQIVDVDEKNQIMTTSVWTRMEWYNHYLKWNMSDYGNIASINVKSASIWLPDLVLYNNADESIDFRGNLDQLDTRVQISHDGKNKWMAPVMLKSKCKIDVEYFPFDSQNCSLKFGSWTYDGKRIDVKKESDNVDLMKYIRSGEWRLVDAPIRRNEVKYYCCPELYPDVTFDFMIKRRTLFYLTNLILPLLVISALIIFVFTLPPQSGERISLSITLLLAMMVFMLMITETIPATSEVVPLVAKFYLAVTVEMAVALVITCYVLRCYHSYATDVPDWMKQLFIKRLGNFFGVKKSKELLQREVEEEKSRKEHSLRGFISRVIHGGQLKKNDGETQSLESTNAADMDEHGHQVGVEAETMVNNHNHNHHQHSGHNHKQKWALGSEPVAEEMLRNLEVISGSVKDKEKEELVQEQWLVVATVMDRLAMWIFTVLLLATIIAIFHQAPGYVS